MANLSVENFLWKSGVHFLFYLRYFSWSATPLKETSGSLFNSMGLELLLVREIFVVGKITGIFFNSFDINIEESSCFFMSYVISTQFWEFFLSNLLDFFKSVWFILAAVEISLGKEG